MVALQHPAPARIDARSKAFAAALEQWLLRFARREALRVQRQHGLVQKADSDEDARRELADLIRRFGVRQAADAANETAGRPITPGSAVDDAISGKGQPKIQVFTEVKGWAERSATRITRETRERVRGAVEDIVREGRADGQSAGEIARRVRTQLHGPDPKERIYAFSPERAALIARTELAQAENAGTMAGYESTAAPGDELEWLAYRDGRSGLRHHERMHGERVKMGEMFVLPSGAQMRHPGDPNGPIGETANCRCSFRRVRGPKPQPSSPSTPKAPLAAAAEQHAAIDVGRPRTVDADEDAVGRAGRMGATAEDLADLAGFPAGTNVTARIFGNRGVLMSSRDVAPETSLQTPTGPASVLFAPASATQQGLVVEHGGKRYTLTLDASGTVRGDAPAGVLAAVQAHVDRLPYTSLHLERFVDQEGGKKSLKNETFIAFPPGRGLGAQVLAQQVTQAERLGVTEIKTYADRDDRNGMVGYYVWARLGYDGPLTGPLAERFHVKTIQELMATPEGRAAWKAEGHSFAGTFDPRPGSVSRRALEDYLREKAAKAEKRRVTPAQQSKGDTPPDISARDEASLDATWDAIGREQGIRPPPGEASLERVQAMWNSILEDIASGFDLSPAQRAPRKWITEAHAKLREAAKGTDAQKKLDQERDLMLVRAVRGKG